MTSISPSNSTELWGAQPEAVIALIRARAEALRTTGRVPADGRKLGLVIEGGAMRSSYSAGGAFALAELGLADVFDEVYATSAGVMNASYFLSNQPRIGITVYYDSCTSALFMNPLRLWKVLDIDYLFDQVIKIDKPLDTQALLAARPGFQVAVIDRVLGAGKMVDVKKQGGEVLKILKAATAMPVFYNRWVEIDGHPCMDAGLSIPFPLPQALAANCTDVLVLLTRHEGYRHQPPVWTNRQLFNAICARGDRRLERIYAEHHVVANASRDLALGRTPAMPDGARIATLCPPVTGRLHRTSSDPWSLHRAATEYAAMMMRVLGEQGECILPLPTIATRRTGKRSR